MFTAAFTVAQGATGIVTITDTSDYSNEPQDDFSDRSIKLWRSDGSLYLDGVIDFPFATDTLEIELTRDYAFKVELVLTPNSPQGGSSYTESVYAVFKAFGMLLQLQLLQGEEADPNILNKANYENNVFSLFRSIVSAEIAISYSQISLAQGSLDRVNNFINKKALYF